MSLLDLNPLNLLGNSDGDQSLTCSFQHFSNGTGTTSGSGEVTLTAAGGFITSPPPSAENLEELLFFNHLVGAFDGSNLASVCNGSFSSVVGGSFAASLESFTQSGSGIFEFPPMVVSGLLVAILVTFGLRGWYLAKRVSETVSADQIDDEPWKFRYTDDAGNERYSIKQRPWF